jgi:hypothetical protein
MTSDSISTDERAALRKAIAERDAANEAVRVASGPADRAGQLLRAAETKLAAFGDVDGAILKHRANSFKNAAQGGGSKPSLALPDDLLKKERGRDEAASAVAAARVAHSSLVGELAEAQAALRKAERKTLELAGQVLIAETTQQGNSLTTIWNDLWASIDALNALRSTGVQLPREVVRTLQSFEGLDHRQFPGNRNEQLARAVQYWKAYRNALYKSADATEPAPINDGVPPSAVERVA